VELIGKSWAMAHGPGRSHDCQTYASNLLGQGLMSASITLSFPTTNSWDRMSRGKLVDHRFKAVVNWRSLVYGRQV